ncbi:BQ2448_2717 [Microbotryum intermedium]|uniref:BQ2448_2717 protein n=1 Tax=Microbotryum intermedium TaxID=269621 RepID=A0A238FEA3_9BASI|nr:BQ2448_2717 [Microbotryum intermedium]
MLAWALLLPCAAFGELVGAFPVVPGVDVTATKLHRQKGLAGKRVFHSAYKPLWEAHGRGQELETLKKVSYEHDDYTLSPDFKVTHKPTIRNYYFDVSEVTAAPDGVSRQMFLVNGRINGELIEVNQGSAHLHWPYARKSGDTINLHVRNWLSVGTGIHFHGLPQREVNYFDGPVGVVTCPIASNSEFTFSFKVEFACGTFFWHGHRAAQLADGLHGPVVVHCPGDPLKIGADFDREQIVMVTDNYHELSASIMDRLRSPRGVYGASTAQSSSAPTPKSGLLLGRGDFDCSNRTNTLKGHSCTKQSVYGEIVVPAGSRTRLRVINAGSHAFFRMSVDEHVMELIEVDATPIDSVRMARIPINAGQRFSAVLDTRADEPGSSFWMRSFAATQCLRAPLNGLNPETLAIVRVIDPAQDATSASASPTPQRLPTSAAFPHELVELCEDPPSDILRPRIRQDTAEVADQVDYFNATYVLAPEGGRFRMNGISYPLLFRAVRGESIVNRSATIILSETPGEGGRDRIHEVILNNLGAGSHPFHLHGPISFIVGSGNGSLSKERWAKMTPTSQNPLRRDVFTVPPFSYTVIRIVADLVGVHAFHCHASPHTSVGMAGALVVRPDLIRNIRIPQESLDMCKPSHFDPGLSASTPEPGRRL